MAFPPVSASIRRMPVSHPPGFVQLTISGFRRSSWVVPEAAVQSAEVVDKMFIAEHGREL